MTADGHTVRPFLRPTDVLARYGGDEFVVVCVGLAEPGHAEAMVARMLAAVAEPLDINSTATVVCTATFGLALTDDVSTVPQLVDRAFEAVTAGKAAGKNRVVRWDAATPPG